MKKGIGKSLVIHMIGIMLSGYTFYDYSPWALGYLGAIYATDIIRLPAIILMGTYITLTSSTLYGIKYLVMMVTIGAIISFCEDNTVSKEQGKKRQKNTNGMFAGLVTGLVCLLIETADAVTGVYTYEKLIMNVAAAVLCGVLTIIFARGLELLTMPEGEPVRGQAGRKTREEHKCQKRLEQLANALERISVSLECLLTTQGRNNNIENDKILEALKNTVMESRRAMAAQFHEVAAMINDLSREDYDMEELEPQRERYIAQKLKARNVALKKISVLRNRRGILEFVITVKGTKGRLMTYKEFVAILEDGLGKSIRPMGEYRKIIGPQEYTYNFTEETNFQIMCGTARMSKDRDSISGDSFAYMELESGQALMSISDGMGTGMEAYRDSQMVVELLEELLGCGFSEEIAIKLINSIFFISGEERNPTTIDMWIIDMYSGVCDFVKLGAAATFVKRGGWVEAIKSTSLPVGVLDKPDIEASTKKLYGGDYVIMVSDGVLDKLPGVDKEQELGRIIMELSNKKPKEMAEAIMKAVKNLGNNDNDDDMTVLVAGVWDRCA